MLWMLPAFLTLALPKDHGPGTTGGGVSVPSGETLLPGRMSLSADMTFTKFERLSDADVNRKTVGTNPVDAHFDAVDWTLLGALEFQYGIVEGLQVGASIGYYLAHELREGHVEAGAYELHDIGRVSGPTDLWLAGKGRLLKGPEGTLSILAGLKAPVGDNEERHEGERLEPSLQPGSGAWDVLVGAAYSRWLTERLTLDAGAIYTIRTAAHHFEIGDQVLAGAAVAWRLQEDARAVPGTSVFLEAVVRHLFESEEDGEEVGNSGGTALFVGPGVRLTVAEGTAISLAVQVPVLQSLHEEQQDALFKVTVGLDWTF